MRSTLKPLLALLAVSAVLVAGCGGDGSTDTSSPAASAGDTSATAGGTAGGNDTTGTEPELAGTITVSGATSLTGAFTEIADGFSEAHPDVEVTFNFDASSTLATQIIEGAPADVYASADEANMTKLTDEDLVAGEPEIFARNELVIVTKPGNPEGIETLADLAGVGVVSLCGEDVPCGKYAAAALANAGVAIDESNVTRGQNAGATLTAVAEGDAVAGIVYVTDAAAAGDSVEAVTIPADVNVLATYPIGVLAASGNAEVAAAFVAFVVGGEGQAVLAEHGFRPPA